jgi:catechol 2,3-dioxygenase-like lactoylglutathione lyase family enzyme
MENTIAGAEADHIAISVSDMDRALTFFKSVLGFTVLWDKTGLNLATLVGLPDAHARQVMLEGHGMRIELFGYIRPQGKMREPHRQCDFGITHFCLSVMNIDTLYRELLAKGVEFVSPPQEVRRNVWAVYFKGPDGIMVELVQRSSV